MVTPILIQCSFIRLLYPGLAVRARSGSGCQPPPYPVAHTARGRFRLLQEIESAIESTGGVPISLDREAIVSALGEAAAAILGAAVGLVGNLLGSLPKLLLDIVICLVVVVTLLPKFDQVVEDMPEISPLGREITHLYYTKVSAMVSSLFKGILLIAFFWRAS